jgi:DNA repair exonuclease SbcCD nuclease subunit
MSKKKNELVTGLVIGDPHLMNKNTLLNEAYVSEVIKIASTSKPTFIVILGDILDTHETIKVAPCKVATEELISGLAKISPVFLIIGNHDLSDPNQFLTDNHIFNPLKRWRNVTVIDYPRYVNIGHKEFVMCPYVPPGRFMDALDRVTEDGYAWDLADCIFAHQEFYGAKYGGLGPSVKGDKWNEDYPPVISGHIHDEQLVGENVYYPGASIQHSFGENHKKYVWLVDFTTETDESHPHFHHTKISLGINRQRMMVVDVSDVYDFDERIPEKYRRFKLKVEGTHTEISAFKKSKKHTSLKSKGVLFSYAYTINKELQEIGEEITRGVETISLMPYNVLFTRVVGTKDSVIKEAYNTILLDTLGPIVTTSTEDVDGFDL